MKNLVVIISFLISFSATSQLENDTLVVGYTSAAPFIVENGQNLEGLNVWLWKRVANNLNLNYILVPIEFSAMLDSIKIGSIDLSINPLTITNQRSKEMEFTHSFYASNATIVVSEVSSFDKFNTSSLLPFISLPY